MNGTAHLSLVPTIGSGVIRGGAEFAPRAADGTRPAALRLTPLRLTPRGRLVVVALFLLTLFAGGVLFGSDSTRATGEAGPTHAYDYVIVQPGQTLWGIAKEVAPQDDPRATIEAIRRLNALPDGGIQAGQRIALP